MRLNPQEQHLVDLIKATPGGYVCPGMDARITPAALRLIRRLERKGVLVVEQNDDGPRFSVAAHG